VRLRGCLRVLQAGREGLVGPLMQQLFRHAANPTTSLTIVIAIRRH
jgi:hypothetical protein